MRKNQKFYLFLSDLGGQPLTRYFQGGEDRLRTGYPVMGASPILKNSDILR